MSLIYPPFQLHIQHLGPAKYKNTQKLHIAGLREVNTIPFPSQRTSTHDFIAEKSICTDPF